ncbi:MAG: hypothetical protein A2Y14_00150 [Verrucomicrobia bacterium GWF2_51_19]|nr:MAG: hypothetical protein A2Y14_00150 [Verrucomicrobia bacterium GWF2_51_19]HCJ11658.1 AAA family ATPase [Opitutae bacterium]
MFIRTLEKKLKVLFEKYPIVGVMGPRQSGKTTLVRNAFPHLDYVNLENLDLRQLAQEDPRGFLKRYNGVILDEVQNVPELFSYLQTISDVNDKPSQFVLTGSHNFLLFEKIAQSLAGRIALTTLLPLSYKELANPCDVFTAIQKGFYPRMHRYDISHNDFYSNYTSTYVERDVRQITNVTDLSLFQKFIKLCAGRIGQVINFTSLAMDCGISQPTAKKWMSILESSYLMYLVQPYHENFNKRLIKNPKLYFYDTGLACYLLGIEDPQQLEWHSMRGELFENLVFSETYKFFYAQGKQPPVFFWRNQSGVEIDMIIERAEGIIPVEVKSGQTVRNDFFNNLRYLEALTEIRESFLVYSGQDRLTFKNTQIIPWESLESSLETMELNTI